MHETAIDVVLKINAIPGRRHSLEDRKKAEMLLAHLKCILQVDRLRPPGVIGVHDEFLLAAIEQHLHRMRNSRVCLLFIIRRLSGGHPSIFMMKEAHRA